MMRFEGDRQLPFAPADAWQKLCDARFLIQCVQGGQTTGVEPTEGEGQCRVRPNLPFVHGTMVVTVRIVEAAAPTELRVLVLGEGSNASSEVDARLTLADHQGGTRVHWIAEVRKLGGMLKTAPATQVQAAAQKVINEVWTLLSMRIGK